MASASPAPGGSVTRRQPVTAVWGGYASSLIAATPPPTGSVQPRATVPVPRRTTARGLWGGQSTPQPHLPGSVQPIATAPHRPHAFQRAVWHGNAVPGIIPQPKTGGLVRRRTSARAVWLGTPLVTANAHGPAVPAPKKRPRITSRAYARGVWRGVTVRTVNNAILGVTFSAGQPYTKWSADLPYTDWSVGKPFTDWDAGLLYTR